MLWSWLTLYLALAALAVVQGLLVIAQTWEHRRFARHRLRKRHRYRGYGRALLLIPCRGKDLGLEDNLETLLQQDYEPYQVRFIVESQSDPAYAVIQWVMARHPEILCEVLVAGPALSGGQKVHNLRMATAELPRRAKYLAFVDSDAQLSPHWLSAITSRLDRETIAVTTGYRWFLPERDSLANLLLYSINTNYALLFGPNTPAFIWGGSWAIRRQRFESLGIRQAWQGTLSDDLVATQVVRRHELQAAFEPNCMVGSPLDMNFREVLAFLRRQYLIGRYYAPRSWAFALVSVLFATAMFWGSLVGGLTAWAWGQPAGGTLLATAAILYGISLLRGAIRSRMATLYFPEKKGLLRRACHFDTWAMPLVGLVHSAALLSSVAGRQLVWRGIRYRLFAGGKAELQRASQPAFEAELTADAFSMPHVFGPQGRRPRIAEPSEVAPQ